MRIGDDPSMRQKATAVPPRSRPLPQRRTAKPVGPFASLLDLQRAAGNHAVSDLMTGPAPALHEQSRAVPATPVVMRDPDPDVEAPAYIERFGAELGDEVRDFLAGQEFGLPSPFLTWATPKSVSTAALTPAAADGGTALVAKLPELLRPADLGELVNRGRKKGTVQVTDDKKTWTEEQSNVGPAKWYPDVAVEVGQMLAKRFIQSMERIAPRYIDARVAAVLAQEAEEQQCLTDAPEPTDGILTSTPADVLTRRNPTLGDVAEVRAKLVKKQAELAAGSEETAIKWAGQVMDQQKVLSQAAFGFGSLVERFQAMTKKVTDATAKLGGFNLPPYVREAMHLVAMQYVQVAATSFFPATADPKLQAADLANRLLPVTIREGTMASIQQTVDDALKDKRKGDGDHASYDTEGMRKREIDPKARLGAIKVRLINDPMSVGEELAALQQEILDLQTEAEIVGNMEGPGPRRHRSGSVAQPSSRTYTPPCPCPGPRRALVGNGHLHPRSGIAGSGRAVTACLWETPGDQRNSGPERQPWIPSAATVAPTMTRARPSALPAVPTSGGRSRTLRLPRSPTHHPAKRQNSATNLPTPPRMGGSGSTSTISTRRCRSMAPPSGSRWISRIRRRSSTDMSWRQ
ncbi:MAG: hypothetical protein WCF36_22005 [Candidatus Nanopelagicales bacterium]